MASTPQILIKNRYHVVPRTIIFVFEDEKVLLQKGSVTKKINAGLWNGLGGHIERNEDVQTAARRELKEEAGITCKDLEIYGTIMIDVNNEEGILLFVFSGSKPLGEISHSEEGKLEWFPIEKLPTTEIVDDVPVLIRMILKSQREQSIFHALYTYDKNRNRITTLA